MGIEIPPGILYLLRFSPSLLTPPLAVYILNSLSSSSRVAVLAPLGTPCLACAMVASIPVALTLKIWWGEIKSRIEAWRLGAVLPPVLPDWTPGGIATLIRTAKSVNRGYIAELLDKGYRDIGTFTVNNRVLFENRIITAEPDYIKIILATQFDHFEKGAETRWLLQPLLGTGVFAADGELWKFHRSMTRPFFSRDRISHFDIFDRHAEDALDRLAERLGKGVAVDFQDLVGRFTLDSATEFLFGRDVQSLSGALPYPYDHPSHASSSTTGGGEEENFSTRFARAFSEAQSITSRRSRYGVHWPLTEFWKDEIKEPMRVVKELIEPIVEEAVRKKRQRIFTASGGGKVEEKMEEEEEEGTLLENLVNETDDLEILRDEIMSLLVAGRDTTASTLTFVIYMLAEHPEVLKRLRKEVLEKVGPSKRPEYEDLKDMKYLRAVINETLRLYPVVPFNIRTSKNATLWPAKEPGGKPYYIPADTRTLYTVLIMHRRKDLWGPDALEFDPDRFLDYRLHKYLTPNPFIFLPFNAGPRICLGQQFAYNEASFFLVRLLQRFESVKLEVDAMEPEERVPEEWGQQTMEETGSRKAVEKVRPRTHLTMYVKRGMWVSMKEASYHYTA
ncbi:cytochrome P450 monooxygenase pc-2 [Macrolepiota fuliginosa MF-IS2]|uniref:Cytochrome P450 monooxygenase pc-2 n=1 Tax=Macrolepiota fuliginosa MF-IS2 TaxID=1400762 RepID=A0A9P6C1U6_9AGAR|nr:cytochrome P450 monooxygenase pc-2 [Macrolepiota fuliginosa MF-IS2]